MIYKGKDISFPAITLVSFFKLFQTLEQLQADSDPEVALFAKNLLAEARQYPELAEGIPTKDFDPQLPIISKLCRTLFPEVLLSNEIKGVIPPFEFKPFYHSTRLKNILEASEEDFSFDISGYTDDQLYIYGCATILSFYYHHHFALGVPNVADIPDKKRQTIRNYRMFMNGDMLEILPTPKAIPITREDVEELLNNFDDIALWIQKFPPDSYIMRGIGIINLVDITVDNALSKITSNLLINSLNKTEDIETAMQQFLGIKELKAGFLLYANDAFYAHREMGIENIILEGKDKLNCKDNLCTSSYDQLLHLRKPLVVTDAASFAKKSGSALAQVMDELPYESYIIAPIINNDEFVGFLELAAPKKFDLNGATLLKLEAVTPVITMALTRYKNEAINKREAVIQQECTTIHPSVKWRFEQEADKFIARKQKNEQATFSDIIFKQVYPLYGQIDIKNSSTKRNLAVLDDMDRQLSLTREILLAALKHTKLPIYEALAHRVEKIKDELSEELSSGSEFRVVHFLENEIHPIIHNLKKKTANLDRLVNKYFDLLHPEMHTIYDQRKKYDEGVNLINQQLAGYLDQRQAEAQEMFPHYFERFKTDGVEYHMYIGQSITEKKTYEPVYLQNLQLWQLMVTCELELEFQKLKTALQTDIEVASLILVYGTPLAIHFRMDEKRFDVEGAYNARYEIVKKRIDKAHIKNTNERITQPGKIAIIYSTEFDALAYSNYLNYLEAKGYIQKNTQEHVDVEDLQGITGLKALRVAVNYEQHIRTEIPLDIKAFMQSLQHS